MTTDERVCLAEELAEELMRRWKQKTEERPGKRHEEPNLLRSEWEKWAQYARQKGLKEAIQLAENMSRSCSFRLNQKRAAECILEAMKAREKTLGRLGKEEMDEILGYTSRRMVWLDFAKRESKDEKSVRDHTGGKPSRRRRGY